MKPKRSNRKRGRLLCCSVLLGVVLWVLHKNDIKMNTPPLGLMWRYGQQLSFGLKPAKMRQNFPLKDRCRDPGGWLPRAILGSQILTNVILNKLIHI
jgi:hypothetical protein